MRYSPLTQSTLGATTFLFSNRRGNLKKKEEGKEDREDREDREEEVKGEADRKDTKNGWSNLMLARRDLYLISNE